MWAIRDGDPFIYELNEWLAEPGVSEFVRKILKRIKLDFESGQEESALSRYCALEKAAKH